jgi:hypothetical protein
MIKTVIFLMLLQQAIISTAACLSGEQLNQLTKAEISYLSQKIPPAFKHALLQKKINVTVENADGGACQARLTVTVPQNDVDDAHRILDAQPAKKIMLSAQGYALPAGIHHEAIFNVDADNLTVGETDVLQTAPLGKLRASLELMYAFLTQKKAEVLPSQTNHTAWPIAIKQQVISGCTAKQSKAVCGCLADTYERTITANQMEYIEYVRANPYALATGANQGFEAIKVTAVASCQ